MEIELEGRAKPLSFKVKATSRESPTQKSTLVLDSDLRTHWSTATNTKEWILLELNEPCLLSHIRIHNKSVLEWEISVGLRYKPETFVKVRPRCEAPRRDVVYPMNYTPCQYVRISCLRGNPIAIFFIQLIGVSVTGLEPEFQPVVNHLLPQILLHKQDAHDMHLQLLKDITSRLHGFLPQLEPDISSFSDAPEANLRFLAMLAGPFYPILFSVNERVSTKSSGSVSDAEVAKNSQPFSALTVSSNYAPRKLRSTSPFLVSMSSSMVFRPDVIFTLLRKAYKDVDLGTVCRTASIMMQKLLEPVSVQLALCEVSPESGDITTNSELLNHEALLDYSKLFGEEFQLPDDQWDCSYCNVLDLGAVEEGILHVLFACASQPSLCNKLALRSSNFWYALPLIQALLPALRPSISSLSDIVDDNFSLWKQSIVHQALNQIIVTSSSSLYRQVLHACAGYLSSFSPSHAKAASILIDLCSSVLAPWMTNVVAKVDLAVELVEDLLGVLQGAKQSLARARAALKYILLAVSGHMDDILDKYKEVKHKILFLVEMFDPYIDPAIASFKSTIAFGDLSSVYREKQERHCITALSVIRSAVQKPGVLPSLESEWRRGSVTPSVLVAILEPRIQLPPDFDLRTSTIYELESSSVLSLSSTSSQGIASLKQSSQDELDVKLDIADTTARTDIFEDASLLFAPAELRSMTLTSPCSNIDELNSVSHTRVVNSEPKLEAEKTFPKKFPVDLKLDTGFTAEYFNVQADYFQLKNFQDYEFRATEFRRLAIDLHSQDEITVEGHDAAIDALLLAAECYVNPFVIISSETSAKLKRYINTESSGNLKESNSSLGTISRKHKRDLETLAQLEKDRDKTVIQILLEAAELDRKYQKVSYGERGSCYAGISDEQVVKLSQTDAQSSDATTLVRQNQSLLCNFILDRLQKECHPMHEVLLQSLVFLLHSATKLCCSPERVVDIVSQSAEYLNCTLTSLYHRFKQGNFRLEPEAVHGIQRRWILLQRLVIASSSGSEGAEFAIVKNSGFNYTELIPPSAWLNRIFTFSGNKYPLVRFLGWMAVSRNAKAYIKDRRFLASDLQQLTYLLSIFSDELAVVENVVNCGHIMKLNESDGNRVSVVDKGSEFSDQQRKNESLRLFHVIYPDLYTFFPNMRKQFGDFGETILEAVGLQLRSLPSTIVPDMLYWFSELCLWPFSNLDRMGSQISPDSLKGYAAKNARVVILFILEAIITEHMEAVVPEIPKLVQVLTSLSRASYCDVFFLGSVLCLLKPIISYSLNKVSDEEKLLQSDSCLNIESLCFGELFNDINSIKTPNSSSEETHSRGLTIFILASVFPDFSIQRKKNMLQSLSSWADLTTFEPTSSSYDYLFAFHTLMQSIKQLLLQTLRKFVAPPYQLFSGERSDSSSKLHLSFLSDIRCYMLDKVHDKLEEVHSDVDTRSSKDKCSLLHTEIEEFSKDLEVLITKFFSMVELCWKLHPQMATKLTISSTECFIYSRCLSSIVQNVDFTENNHNSSNTQNIEAAEADYTKTSTLKSAEQILVYLRIGLEGISEIILSLQEKSGWEVASVIMDCLLEAPHCCSLGNAINMVCSAIKKNSFTAPKISWRLRTDKWLSNLIARDLNDLQECGSSVADLFCTLLGHPEPEQRFIALRLLGKLIGQNMGGVTDVLDFSKSSNLFSPCKFTSIPEPVITLLVSSTWDLLVAMASSDTSFHLQSCAMALLVHCIPFSQRHQLQSFMAAADSVNVLGKLSHCEGPLLQLSLAIICGAVLYSSPGDVSLIPQNVWRDIEALGFSKSESRIGDLEKKTCQILYRLKDEDNDAKEALKEVLSASPSKQISPDFVSTREEILQVMANLTSSESYLHFFTAKVDREVMELEEAEIELGILKEEYAPQKSITESKGSHVNDDSRLQQIKDSICSLEKSSLREDIAMRMQRKLMLRHTRQKDLEAAALKEAELLQILDIERAVESEKEIERQRLLELERAKTRELRHALEIEKERQTQREVQLEIEQAESGVRPPRRDLSSTANTGRGRDRYRERENGREGNTRASQLETSPTVVLSSRSLLSRDRVDESGYEESFEGSRDSGDAGSTGDPELGSAFFEGGGSGQKQGGGSRGPGKQSRQAERRREGKWERKQHS